MGDDDNLPALVVDTRIDHGIIPVGSLTREESSLSPGLGSAVSTLSLETADGDVIELPGKIYSEIKLDGDLLSYYKLEPGSNADLQWGAADIKLLSDASERNVQIDGFIESIATVEGDASITMRGLTINTDQTQTDVGIPVGDVTLELELMNIDMGQGVPFRIEPARFESTTTIANGRLDSDGAMRFTVNGVPQMDGMGFDVQMSLSGADAQALGRLQAAAQAMSSQAPPDAALFELESYAQDVLAAGLSLNFERLNVSLPQGDIDAVINVDISESDRDSFEWTNLLLALNANGRIEIAETLVMMAQLLSPEMSQYEQFLIKDGDAYEIELAYERGRNDRQWGSDGVAGSVAGRLQLQLFCKVTGDGGRVDVALLRRVLLAAVFRERASRMKRAT